MREWLFFKYHASKDVEDSGHCKLEDGGLMGKNWVSSLSDPTGPSNLLALRNG